MPRTLQPHASSSKQASWADNLRGHTHRPAGSGGTAGTAGWPSRRQLQQLLLGTAAGLVLPKGAGAYEFPMWSNMLQPVAPSPIKFPRRQLDQRFAVLLMRSSYDAADALDFVPMDEFQKDFWKLRASEQIPYLNMYAPIKPRVGDLTDALYFDFISFSQYATISSEIKKGRKIFKEYCEECDGSYKVIQRSSSLPDFPQLPSALFTATGDTIYDGLVHGFRGKEFNAPGPLPAGTPIPQVLQRLQQLLQIMVDEGYAIKANVSDGKLNDEGKTEFQITIQGPATLWGIAALSSRQSLVLNAFDAMVTDAFLRACGRTATFSIDVDDTGFTEDWVVA